MTHLPKAARREFLRKAGALSILGGATPFALNLLSVGNAAAQSTADYRALICLFMFGGNDCHNTVIPYDTAGYNAYSAARSAIALPYGNLVEIAAASAQGGRRLALPQELAPVATLFAQKKAAVLANVGTLLAPTSLDDFKAGRNLPPKLFSHNDQQATWQAFSPEGAKVGWGGRMADLVMSQNADTTFTAISASGNAVLLSGSKVLQYQVGSTGATAISGANASTLFGASGGSSALRSLLAQNSANLIEQDYAAVTKRSTDAAAKVSAALATVPISDATVALPDDLASDSLAQQMQVILRLMAVRGQLGAKRQVFFLSLGGFDTHSNELKAQAALLTRVGKVIDYFYQSSVKLGVANQATLFTASDFGRTLASNGEGADHGWGGHHFIVGGAVNGGDLYGQFPDVRLGTTANPNPLDTGSGRLLPTTSVDQYAATLARWFGVADSDMALVAPNIGNFASRYLAFI